MKERAFTTGQYMQAMKDNPAYLTLEDHKKDLRKNYEKAFRSLKRLRWRNPFASPTPRVLQIGFALAETAQTFKDFVHEHNPNAQIIHADSSTHPLQDALQSGIPDARTHLVRGDARELPIQSNSIDLAETDALMQFLSTSDKETFIAEVFRILRPGGVFTTRDWMLPRNTKEKHRQKEIDRHKLVKKYLHVSPFFTARRTVEEFFQEAGFEVVIHQDLFRKNFHRIIARKPEDTSSMRRP